MSEPDKVTPPGYSEWVHKDIRSLMMQYKEHTIYLNRFNLEKIGEGDIELGMKRARVAFMLTISETETHEEI